MIPWKPFLWIVGWVAVCTLLFSFLVDSALAADIPKYDRASQFGGWIDADGDCQDTRQEVLIEESLTRVTLNSTGCRVETGLWLCEFTGEYFNNPRQVDIDHRVPLKEAWLSGAYNWSKEERIAYANDLDHPGHLLAVKAGSNRSKGAKDPAEWMPPMNKGKYVLEWRRVKRNYNLDTDLAEQLVIMYWSTVDGGD